MKEKIKRLKLSRMTSEESYLINLIDKCIVTKCETIDVYSNGDVFFVYDRKDKKLTVKNEVYIKIDDIIRRWGTITIIEDTLSDYLGIEIISTDVKKELV